MGRLGQPAASALSAAWTFRDKVAGSMAARAQVSMLRRRKLVITRNPKIKTRIFDQSEFPG
jgi:hypothetical protein